VPVLLTLGLAPVLWNAGAEAHDDHAPAPRADVRLTVARRELGAPLRGGFVGVSLEYPALTAYAGRDPGAIPRAFERLIASLAPGRSPVLRIGGDSTDTTWWPAPGVRRPAGVTYTLSPRWLAVLRRLLDDLHARVILGVDLEAGDPALARAESRAFAAGLGRRILALEVGNEPTRYAHFPWYHAAPGVPVFARRHGYGFSAFAADFHRVARLVWRLAPLAGPTLGGYDWMAHLAAFLAAQRHLRLVTFHRYPLNRCFTAPGAPDYPTVRSLLSPAASRGLAAGLARYVRVARRDGAGFRVDETNSVACGGKRGVSDTFAAALWAIDALFSMARAGVTGINVHTFPGAAYALFRLHHGGGRLGVTVSPEYYGLLLFSRAAPAGSRLLSTSARGPASVREWATHGPGAVTRVTLINDDLARRHVVLVRVAGARGPGTVARLRAPSVTATTGTTLAGVSSPMGSAGGLGELAAPTPAAGGYLIALPPASAALLTVRAP